MAPKAAEKAEAKVAVEGEKKEGEKGKGKGAAKDKPKKSALTKSQAMAQIPSITADDDEREATSKKISWILRKGAAKVNISMSSDGWCKFADLCNAELLEDEDKTKASEDKIMSVIDESNKQKNRYETKDTDDGKLIRAIKREDRKSADGSAKSPAKEAKSPVKNDGGLQVEASTGLRAEAQVFKPGAGASMAGYPGMAGGYPGYGYPFGGFPQMYNPYAAAYGGYPGYGGAAAPAAPPAQGGSDRFQGRIKSFNAEKGYGFVESAQATQVYGRDVFLHKAHIGTFSIGAFVTFAVEMNKQGMPQARDLIGSDGVAAKGGGKGKGKGKGDGKGKEKKTKGKGKGEKKDGEKADAEGEAKAPDAPAAEAAADPAPAAEAA